MAFITNSVTFKVEDETDYSLTITIGNGVAGGATTMVDFQGNLQSPTVINVPLGKGKDIRGQSLKARSTFTANGPGNFAGVDYTLNTTTQSLSKPLNGDLFWTFSTPIKFT